MNPEELQDLMDGLPEALRDGRISQVLVLARKADGELVCSDTDLTCAQAGALAEDFTYWLRGNLQRAQLRTRYHCRGKR